MVYLKEINNIDVDKEYEAIISIPEYENGFENEYFNVSKEDFVNTVVPILISQSKGMNLKPGYVPNTYFFLWDDDEIVGLFKVRHHLTEILANGVGHVGYGIIKKYRGKGYATKGLMEVVKIAKNLIKEDEIYLSSNKDNPQSFRVQMKCGAYLSSENEKKRFTRIPLNK